MKRLLALVALLGMLGVSSPASTADVNSAIAISPTTLGQYGIASTKTSVAASSLVIKASPGNLYWIQITTGASAGYLMVHDAVSAPGDGTVTPILCQSVAATTTAIVFFPAGPPLRGTVGLTAVFSTTGCFSQTSSATAFISAQVQ